MSFPWGEWGEERRHPLQGSAEEVGCVCGSICLEIVQQRHFLSEKAKDLFQCVSLSPEMVAGQAGAGSEGEAPHGKACLWEGQKG